jgi:hypothetical protein
MFPYWKWMKIHSLLDIRPVAVHVAPKPQQIVPEGDGGHVGRIETRHQALSWRMDAGWPWQAIDFMVVSWWFNGSSMMI